MEAFPRYDDLRYMLSTRLEENIEAALPVGSSMRNYILDLVVQMEALGRLKELLLGALKENPRNPHLLKCGIDFEAITAPESIELPELRPVLEFSAAAREALFTHKDVLVLSQPSDYYREDMLVAPS